MMAKNVLTLILAILAVTGGGIALMLGEVRQGDLPKDGDVPVTDWEYLRQSRRPPYSSKRWINGELYELIS